MGIRKLELVAKTQFLKKLESKIFDGMILSVTIYYSFTLLKSYFLIIHAYVYCRETCLFPGRMKTVFIDLTFILEDLEYWVGEMNIWAGRLAV